MQLRKEGKFRRCARVYLKSRKYRLFLQTQPDFALKSLKSCLCLRNIRHFFCFLIHLKEENAWNLKRQPLSARWNTDPLRLKKLTAEREDAVPMAHLFDMDY